MRYRRRLYQDQAPLLWFVQHLMTTRDLRKDSDLHVVDDQRERGRLKDIPQRLGDVEPVEAVHDRDVTLGLSSTAGLNVRVCTEPRR
jgi:hypothetical protein